MSDTDPDQELDTIYVGLGWRTYEQAFGDRAEAARAACRSIGEHANRAHTRGELLSPRLLDLVRRELAARERSFVGKPVLDAGGQQVGEVVAEAQAPDGSIQITTRLKQPPPFQVVQAFPSSPRLEPAKVTAPLYPHPTVSVRFDVGGDDAAASRIAVLLEALGFKTERVGLTSSLTWRIEELVRRHHLTQVERQVLEAIVADRNNAQIGAELGFSRATVKWHTHNLLSKTGAGSRQALITMLLGSSQPGVDA